MHNYVADNTKEIKKPLNFNPPKKILYFRIQKTQ